MYKHTLILGGKGLIGSHLVEAMVFTGISVRVFDRASVNLLIAPALMPQVELIEKDFSDAESLRYAL